MRNKKPQPAIQLFYSYAHEDQGHREAMEKSLAPLRRSGNLQEWSDKNILAGEGISKKTKEKMDQANIIVFLFSPDFIDSPECTKEWEYAKRLSRTGKNLFRIPVIVRTCGWPEILGKDDIMAVPKDGQPVTGFADSDVAWHQVYERIKEVVERLAKSPSEEIPMPTKQRENPTVKSLSIRREGGFFADALHLEWTAPHSKELITGYRLQHRVASGGPDTGWLYFNNPHQGIQPNFEVNQVPQSPRFAFRIQSRSKAGWNQWSKVFSEVKPEWETEEKRYERTQSRSTSQKDFKGSKPRPIAEVRFERTCGIFKDAVSCEWIAPQSTAGNATEYHVQFKLHQGYEAREWTDLPQSQNGRNPSYRFNNVPKPHDNQFSMRVRAKNDAGWGPWSQEFRDPTG